MIDAVKQGSGIRDQEPGKTPAGGLPHRYSLSPGLNMSLIERELSRNKGEHPGELAWLEESYRNFSAFFHALKTTQDRFSPLAGKSVPLKRYDFFYDLITRHQGMTTPAFRWYDPVQGWQEISYGELGAAATKKAAFWINSQVEAGQHLCIMHPFGAKYVISLLAAWKIGLVISSLPPQGNRFWQRRLEALNPDHIVSEEIFSPFLQPWQERLLPEVPEIAEVSGMSSAKSGMATGRAISATFPAGAVIALCFDPSSQTPHIPVELTSDAAYLSGLRDGMIALNLRPGQAVAAPGFHFFETQPALVIASLMTGGTYIHLEVEDIAKNPKLLTAYPLKAIGVSSRVRDLLFRHPVEAGTFWHSWFRNPAESFDLDQWQSFIQTVKLEEAYAGNLKWDAATGGCSLFSVRRKGQAHAHVLPSAGGPWRLTDLSGSGHEALGDCGLFSPSAIDGKEKEVRAGASVLARRQKEWLFVKSLVSGREGRRYPQNEILEIIMTAPELPYCSCCSMVEAPALGASGDFMFILLIFTAGRTGMAGRTGINEADIHKKIMRKIEREMGREFLPDRIRFLPLFPRFDQGGKIDHEWCKSQYLSGSFFRKSQREIYRCLARLRRLVREAKEKDERGKTVKG
ncbi:MAG: hypothetical protein AB1847_18990 [bacterium]